MIYVLFNPLSCSRNGEKKAHIYNKILSQSNKDENIKFINTLEIKDYNEFLDFIGDNKLIIAGGDGTLNKFINSINSIKLKKSIYYLPAGSGNDFMHDVKSEMKDGIIKINKYITNLPTVTVKGKTYKFINGIGFGLDGYCSSEGDIVKEKSKRRVNYALIALKGFLYKFSPRNAVINVDGVIKRYQLVWMAPTMNGAYYGGGLKIAPGQDRLNKEHTVQVVAVHNAHRLKVLTAFPSIFTSKHINLTNIVDIRTGYEITVEFDRPTNLQIDGETILDVKSYTVKTAKSTVLDNKDDKMLYLAV